MADPQGRKWNDMIQVGQGAAAAIDIIQSFGKGTISKAIMPVPGTRAYQGAWQETIKAAEEANEPGRFTAFIGYEWTSNTGGNNLHRNVIFRDNARRPARPSSRTPRCSRSAATIRSISGSGWPRYEAKTGGNVLAIAHNGNLSNGRMFPTVEAFGKTIDRAYAENARQVGAALRGHADQGRRRGASVPLAQRRVRQLREVGQGQPRRQRCQDQGHARVRVRALGA